MGLTKGEKTRATILEVSKQLILKKGYNATSMRDIAETADITPGAIYNHFKGKEEIFETLIEESMPLFQMNMLMDQIEITEPEETLRATIRQVIEMMLSHEDYIRLGLIDTQERQGRNLKKIPPRMYPIFKDFISRIVEKDPGLFREMPVEKFLRVLVSLIFGYVYTEFVANPMETLPLPDIDWVDALVDVFMYGVVNQR